MKRPTGLIDRIFAGAFGAIFLAAIVNYCMDLNWFGGRFDRAVMGIGMMVLTVYLLLILPAMRERRNRKSNE